MKTINLFCKKTKEELINEIVRTEQELTTFENKIGEVLHNHLEYKDNERALMNEINNHLDKVGLCLYQLKQELNKRTSGEKNKYISK